MKTFIAILILSASAFAATVTSITCSGQTATVNATAHGLVASQGFSLSGTAATFNSTASTVAANSFTFVLPAGTACSGFTSGYTAVVAAKQIIDIGATPNPLAPGGPTVTLSYLGWYTTVYPTALCTSAGVPIPPLTTCPVSQYPAISPAEQAALWAGTTVELQNQVTYPAATSASTVSSGAVTQYNAMQAGFTGYLLAGGYYWNGTAWTHQ
jgi:hypothetical protein